MSEKIEIGYGKAPEPAKIKLIKQSKNWAWEISLQGSDMDAIKKEIDRVNLEMIATYGGLPEA